MAPSPEHDAEIGSAPIEASESEVEGEDSTRGRPEGFDWETAERAREWERQHSSERFRLAAEASSALLGAILGTAATLVLALAGFVGRRLGRERPVAVFTAMGVVAAVAGLYFWWRYVRDARALREFDRDVPRDERT